MGASTIHIQGENAFVMVDNCEHHVCPDGDVRLLIPVGVQGDPGTMTLSQFTVLMNLYNAALPEYLTNADAWVILGAGKEFVFAQGSPEAPQGVKAVTYAP